MAGCLIKEIERIKACASLCQLDILLSMYAVDVDLFKPIRDDFSHVYGTTGSTEDDKSKCRIQAVVIVDDFLPVDPKSAGSFDEAWMYTTSPKVEVGDLIAIVRGDSRSRRYKVINRQAIGQTRAVFYRFYISSVAD
jgi:hypothetical protein